MKIVKLLLVFFIIISISEKSHSQIFNSPEARGGSVYSSIGVGFPIDNTSTSFLSQGIIGVTGINPETSSLANPGLWASSIFTRAATGIKFTRSNIETSSSKGTNLNLATSYLHLLLPINAGKIGLSIGLYPVTRTDYKFKSENSFRSSSTDESQYINQVQSIGGINKFELGFGFKVGKHFSIGYAPSVAFLSINNTENLAMNTFGFFDNFQKINFAGASVAHRFGFTGVFKGFLLEEDGFSVGASMNLPYTLEVTKEFSSFKNIEGLTKEVTLEKEVKDVTMPYEVNFGIGYAPNIIMNFAFEGQIQNWSNYKNEFEQASNKIMVDRFKFGFGGQYHPYRKNSATILSSFKYSAGLSFDSGHLNLNGKKINTLWLNTGIGIPSKIASFIDLSLQYGLRGTTVNNLFREKIFAFGLSINLTELMFIRPKLK